MDQWPDRAPEETHDYSIPAWREHLGGGDYVVSAVWTVSPPGPVIGPSGIDETGDETALAVMGGGELGRSYVFTCTATTSLGWTVPRSRRQFVTRR